MTQLTDLQAAGLNSSKIPANTNIQAGLLSKRQFLQPHFLSCSHLSLFHKRKKGEGGEGLKIFPFSLNIVPNVFSI